MAIHPGAQSTSQSESPLGRLIRERGLDRFALVFVTGEGRFLPNGDEEKSGHVIDEHGRIFSFWTGWDTERNAPTLSEWEAVDASPSWPRSAEYREARAEVGLDTPSSYSPPSEDQAPNAFQPADEAAKACPPLRLRRGHANVSGTLGLWKGPTKA